MAKGQISAIRGVKSQEKVAAREKRPKRSKKGSKKGQGRESERQRR